MAEVHEFSRLIANVRAALSSHPVKTPGSLVERALADLTRMDLKLTEFQRNKDTAISVHQKLKASLDESLREARNEVTRHEANRTDAEKRALMLWNEVQRLKEELQIHRDAAKLSLTQQANDLKDLIRRFDAL